MDLNNHSSFSNIDKQNYLSEIESLPGQLENAYQSSLRLSLPEWQGIRARAHRRHGRLCHRC